LASPFSGHQEKKVTLVITDIENSLGRWVRGQITLSLIVGFLVYIGLTALGVPSALPLALIAGIFEIVPIIGPTISAIPSILIALALSPILALATAALYFVIQQLENNLIVPTVMSRAVGVNPLITIIALLIGAKLAGIMGVIISVPVVVIIKIIIRDLVITKDSAIEEIEKDLL
jgi:predicted PurR-regulated permease PerM